MRDVFLGWKRKLGVLLLAMTCGLVVVWVRSFSTTDDHVTLWKNHSLYSHNGSISWNVRYPDNSPFDFGGRSMVKQKSRWEWCGIVYCDLATPGSGLKQYWIADWYLITPLTAFAAWLLISKTRRPKPDPSIMSG